MSVPSKHGFADTLAALEQALRSRGQSIFAQIDHAKGATEAGMALGPTTVVIFGNPKIGTPLMQENQTVGIELPLRILVWQDAGEVRLGYRDPRELAARYGLGASAEATLGRMATALAAITREAAGEAAGTSSPASPQP